MTLWEWRAAAAGVARFNGAEDQAAPPSPEDHDRALLEFERNNPWDQ